MERFEPMVAIDVATKEEALNLFDELAADTQHTPIVKIGMELYYAFGPGIVKQAKQRGLSVFLDLKSYDIPNTVHRAMQVIGKMGVRFTTTHAAGGTEMLKAAKAGLVEGAREAGLPAPKLLAITELTSIDEHILKTEQHVDLPLIDVVKNYAQVAERAGLDGVICSAQEVKAIRSVTQPTFLCVTPGIRPDLSVHDDQKRVVTPAQARELGSNGIVVGRPITQSKEPIAAYQAIRQAFMEGE
ncbi:orotidine-5'-phosphate decarboxylase [Limosilactobacillus caecicola]|uniref:orotidine-5'-phosphate decarboxylase n=1 Tax=Limosilactobacillus caecicola TaxID=2941332 RepID=UPI00203B5FB9|nr:orotidine-5'-phosphate decarboxylase [Limosilactobacillus caecicola]